MGTQKNTIKIRKKKNQNPESQFQFDLNLCSKNKDLHGAIALYQSAITNNTRLNQHHLNALLYLCSNSVADPSLRDLASQNGFLVFDRMSSMGIAPNEATITAVARLAAARGDGDYAFGLVKSMGKYNAVPRLRTYDPALYCFCEKLEAEKAYELEEHMGSVGVSPEEPELAALLKVSAETKREDRVYLYLHKLRSSVRSVGESTAKLIRDWFCGEKASEVGEVNWDAGRIEEAVSRNGGGWHGRGWIGKGDWVVSETRIASSGWCGSCGERLFCVDIDDEETEKFAQSVALLAMEREVKSNFREFQDWLEKHGDYEAIVDGANIGLYQQNFADGGFSVSQLDAVVRELYNRSGSKWPLVVLHNKRSRALLENASHRKLVKEWVDNGVLYTTPNGSNDDWYWLYATVKLKCLLVTNDEMRDHIFELLGSSFFLKWKERHQVRYTFVKGNLQLQMPPPYSSVIQESEKGTWHVPVAGDCTEDSEKTWLCITRPSVNIPLDEVLQNVETSQNGNDLCCDVKLLRSCTSGSVGSSSNTSDGSLDLSETRDKGTIAATGKRKERSSSTF
ncbi:Protein-only RNase P, C-terminal [Parasponia andersonii]|uniref:ribonuclease P n=1 Tax=Parasponia andersonii TaxID=3476 RepID=A0A2P5AXV8_PARAD|nr:Protein-only RNase P, C-terminal [Parasponia andersonii]